MAGQPITLTLPSNGDAFSTAAPQVVTAITALETELERKVVPADMSMSSDLSFLVNGSNYRVKDLLATSYVLNASALSASTYPRSLYFTGTDGDLYANDGAGRQVRMTSGGAVNIATSGAITSTGSPAYGASGVEFRWDGADLEFEARSGSGTNAFADIRLDDVLFNDGSSNYIRMTAPSISNDYTLTLPNGLPATTRPVTMSSTGTLAYETVTLWLVAGKAILNTNAQTEGAFRTHVGGSGAPWSAALPFEVPVGRTITSIVLYGNNAASADLSMLIKHQDTTGTTATVGGTNASVGTGNISITVSPDHVVLTQKAYFLEIESTNAASVVYIVGITYA